MIGSTEEKDTPSLCRYIIRFLLSHLVTHLLWWSGILPQFDPILSVPRGNPTTVKLFFTIIVVMSFNFILLKFYILIINLHTLFFQIGLTYLTSLPSRKCFVSFLSSRCVVVVEYRHSTLCKAAISCKLRLVIRFQLMCVIP